MYIIFKRLFYGRYFKLLKHLYDYYLMLNIVVFFFSSKLSASIVLIGICFRAGDQSKV